MSELPAAWHPDPRGRHEQRYWDGTRWTEHVADAGVTGQDPFDSEAPPAGPQEALGAVADAVDAPIAHKPASLATLLTIAIPGMGHVYLSRNRTNAFILLAATVAAVVLSCFISFPLAVLVYLAAVAFAMVDLRPSADFSDLGAALSWRLVIGGGVLLAISLLLPWYRDAAAGVALAVSGFRALELIDVVLLAVGLGAALLGAINLTRGTSGPPVAHSLVVAAGVLAVLLVLFRLLFTPDGPELGIERSFGLLVAFVASVLLAGGAAGAATSKR